MKTSEKVTIVIALVLAVLAGSLFFSRKAQTPANIGGAVTDSLISTTTDGWTASVGSFKLLACGSGVLSSVIIGNETAGSFNLYDATTTRNGAVYGTTTITKIYASQAEGSYEYNVYFKTGLIAENQSTNVASTTITFRGNPVCQ
jgi:hypothetical protein